MQPVPSLVAAGPFGPRRKRTVMAASSLYGCLLLLLVGQQAHSATPAGDSCGPSFVSKPGLGLADLPATATALSAVSVSSAQECRDKCCSVPGCTLAMTRDNGEVKACRLANCLHEGVDVCELGPAPDMHSYQQEEVGGKPTVTALKSTGAPPDRYWQSDAIEPKEEFKYEDYCAPKAVTGPCRAAFPRWYYDITSSSCAQFIYGGCKGNKNNYISKEKCDQKCVNPTGAQENNAHLRPFPHSTTAVALAVLLAVMIAALLGAMVVVFVKMARRHHKDSSFAAVWSPIDDKECLMNNAYTL